MIIFDLACLANDEHRRHFIDPRKRDDCYFHFPATLTLSEGWFYKDRFKMSEPPIPMKFEPDFHAYYEACGEDDVFKPVLDIFHHINHRDLDKIQIWSDRDEFLRAKTNTWLLMNVTTYLDQLKYQKMRPFDDMRPQEELFSYWMTEYYASLYPKLEKDAVEGAEYHRKEKIEFVFSSHKPTIDMFRNRGVFVFDCGQGI